MELKMGIEKVVYTFSGLLLAILCLPEFAQAQRRVNNLIVEGNRYYNQGNWIGAGKAYKKALDLNPKDAAALFNNGNVLSKLKNYSAARNFYAAAANHTINKNLKQRAYYNKGVSEAKANQLDQAIGSFKKSLELDPNDRLARENLEKALKQLKTPPQNKNNKNNQKNNPPKDNNHNQNKDKKNQNKQDPKSQPPESRKQKDDERLLNQLRDEENQLRNMQRLKGKQQNPDKDW